ncbi:CHAT domain-containing protein [Motilibacter peucedani]|uniref:CHAT domain-containing protein n=1 Tax=Motilibacter peucedani TaxID=598650 RepID=A0A420XU15_9ACTN|nr:CHAT domain-containing protein [Motilibacter peucedani]RKS80231.1 CHAT domain-containing protein [Motilibacter peucedani]
MHKHAGSDPVGALPHALQLLAEARQAGDPAALTAALRAAAWAHRGTSAHRTALRLLDEAVRTSAAPDLADHLADALVSRAAVLSELGRTDAAQRDLSRARSLVARSRRPALALQQATLLANLGRAEEALRLLRLVEQDAASSLDERVKAANNVAVLESQLGRHAAALRHVAAASAEAPAAGPATEAGVTSTAAWVHVQAGRPVAGIALFERAGTLYAAAGLPLGEHYTEYADALADLRLLPEALSAAERAVTELAQTPLMRAEAQLRVARLLLLTGDGLQAATVARKSARAFRRQGRTPWAVRASALALEAQADSLTAAQLAALRRQAAALREHGLLAEAVEAYLVAGRVSGRAADLAEAGRLASRGPVLLRLKGRVAGALAAGSPEQVLRHARAGLADLARHRDALPSMELRAHASGHGVELGELAMQAVLPSQRPAAALAWMERTRAAALRTSSAAVLSVADLRAALAGATLVEYAVVRGTLHAVVVEPTRTRLVALGPADDAVRGGDALLFALRRLARAGAPAASQDAARTSTTSLLARLSARLLEPLGLDRSAPLVVVPAGPLQHIPWTPLHDGPVTVAPSATVWASTVGAVAPPRTVALVAGPELPGAVAEVSALAEQHPGATCLQPPHSTPAATLEAVERSDLAHLACHGRIRVDNPLFSSLVLTDGALTVQELGSRTRTPPQVVLAACDSAVQTTYAGEESLGFVSALLDRGTRGLLASTVLLPDLDVVPLMRRLHAELVRGTPVASALHTARSGLDLGSPGELVASCAFQAYGAG